MCVGSRCLVVLIGIRRNGDGTEQTVSIKFHSLDNLYGERAV